MLLVMWAVAPVGWMSQQVCVAVTLYALRIRRQVHRAVAAPTAGIIRRPRTCSLPRHTIRERIEQLTVRITTACKPSPHVMRSAVHCSGRGRQGAVPAPYPAPVPAHRDRPRGARADGVAADPIRARARPGH
ncbi:hypothetical protein GCM10027615_70660 [Plantactinospora veratri]